MAVRTIWTIHEVGKESLADFVEFTDETAARLRANLFTETFGCPHEARPTDIPVKFLIASPRTSDNYLGFGAQWVEDLTHPQFRFIEVPAEHATWQAMRLGSGGCLLGTTSAPFETLADALDEAEKLLALGLVPRP